MRRGFGPKGENERGTTTGGTYPPGFLPAVLMIASSQFAWTSMVPLLPSHAMSLGAHTAQVGLVIAGFGFGRLLVNLPAGLLAGQKRAKVALGLGAVIGSLVTASTSLVDSFTFLLILRVAMGLAAGVAQTCGLALIGQLSETGSRGRVLSRLQLLQLVATTLGPVSGGLLAVTFGTREALAITGATAAIVSIVAFSLSGSIRPARRTTTSVGHEAHRPHATAGWTTNLLAASGVGFAIFLVRFGGEHTLIPLMGADLGLDVSTLGILLSAISLSQAAGVVLNSRVYDRAPRKKIAVIVPCGLLCVVVLCMGAFSALIPFVILTVVMGIAQGMLVPASTAHLIDTTPPTRLGLAVGLYRTLGDLAAVLGPVIVGALIAGQSAEAAAATLAVCALVLLIVFCRYAHEPSRTSSLSREDHYDEV